MRTYSGDSGNQGAMAGGGSHHPHRRKESARKPARSRAGMARELSVIVATAIGLWIANAPVTGILEFSLPSGYTPGVSWAGQWRLLVQFYGNPLVFNGLPAGTGILGLLMWWRTASPRLAVGTMCAVGLAWWVGILVYRVISGVPLSL